MPSFEEDFAWQEKFRAHFSEIARLGLRVDVAPAEEDWKRNTDFVLSTVVTLPKREIRVSARARRYQYKRQAANFTIRLDRPSGVQTEMPKLRAGWGDFFVYGFEAEPESDRLGPWFVGNLELLRDYLRNGGYYEVRRNQDGSSRLAAVYHEDMPLGFVLASDGIPLPDYTQVWGTCRNPNWDGPTPRFGMCAGSYVMPLGDHLGPDDGYWRQCMCCGFRWRAGWPMKLCHEPITHWNPDLSYEAQAARFRARYSAKSAN